ncbi:MAG: hypothetical protein U9P71_04320 [Campylobacterota bacterium]|nr:hypothetical protein [Campylobacterota bacterium]
MNLPIVLTLAVILSIAFHFIGVYANAKKTVWLMIVLMWAGSINIATNEINDKGYKNIEKMRDKYEATDRIIAASEPEVSLYELIGIKKSFNEEKKKQKASLKK